MYNFITPCCTGLRCGDANAADFVLKQFSNVGGRVGSSIDDVHIVNPAVSDLVSELSSLQKNSTIFFHNQFFYPTQSLIQSRQHVADLYERIQMRSKPQSPGGGGMGEEKDPSLYYRNWEGANPYRKLLQVLGTTCRLLKIIYTPPSGTRFMLRKSMMWE